MLIFYKYHGLAISSEIPLPELKTISKTFDPDVIITITDVPTALEGNGVIRKNKITIKENLALINIPETGRYLVRGGKDITVFPNPKATPRAVRHYILGRVFNICLYQKKLFPIHASAIEVNGIGVAFGGESGIGKSTIAAALALKGYPLISDDTIVVRLKNGIPYIAPAYPRLKLWEDTIENLKGINPLESQWLPGYKKGKTNERKYGITPSFIYSENETPLKVLYKIEKNAKSSIEVQIDVQNKTHKTLVIKKCASKSELIEGMGNAVMNSFFDHCVRISKEVDVKTVLRGRDIEINDFADIIEQEVLKTIKNI